MEIEIIKKEARREYPYVGRSDVGLEVLFIRAETGYKTNSDSRPMETNYRTNWEEHDFTPIYNGRLIQTKDKITFEVE